MCISHLPYIMVNKGHLLSLASFAGKSKVAQSSCYVREVADVHQPPRSQVGCPIRNGGGRPVYHSHFVQGSRGLVLGATLHAPGPSH